MTEKRSGRINRIRLKGFMTYDDLEIKPAKGLNLIIGLNGSGKSSIMSAICLGLGGKPQYTGRSVQLQDFIKYNHSKATIEIELESRRGKSDEICRVIQADKNLWYLNNTIVNLNQITAVIKKYNIDMSNLCQFLPQEKVAEFSRMNKKERLVNMIQAIGDPSLVSLFDELKTLRKEFCSLDTTIKELEITKVAEENKNARLLPEIEKQDERLKLEHELKVLIFKKMSSQYNYLQIQAKEAKIEKKRLEEEVLKAEEELKELKAEKTRLSSEFDNYRSVIHELNGNISRCLQNLNNYSENLGTCHEEIDNAKISYKNNMAAKQEQLTKLTGLQKKIEAVKELLNLKKDDEASLRAQLRQNTKAYENVKQNMDTLDSEIQKTKLLQNALLYNKNSKLAQIKRISDEESKKYEVLRRKYPDAFTALQWLQQNRSSFKVPISPPALVSINVENDDFSKYIENTFKERDLAVFVIEDKGDLERFVKILKHEKKLAVNFTMAPRESLADFTSPVITNEMRNAGIDCFLKDLFTAPDPLMRYLCKIYRIHKVPICNKQAERNLDAILGFNSVFFIESEKISGRRSNYGQKHMSVKRDVVMRKNILPNIKDNSAALRSANEELRQMETSLTNHQEKLNELNNQRAGFERSLEQLRSEKSNINGKIRKLDELKQQLRQLTASYNQKQAEIIDEEEEKTKLTNAICQFNAKKMEIIAEMHKSVKKILLSKKEKAVRILLMRQYSGKISSLDENISTVNQSYESFKSQCSLVQQKSKQLKKIGMEQYKELEEYKNTHGIEGLVPLGDLDEIQQLISNVEAQLELTNEDIAPVIAEYKEREKIIVNTQEQVVELKTKIKDLETKMMEKKQDWLPPLMAHIRSVNEKFSEYYKILKCAGEISLDQTDDEDDFPNYGLQIKLKYRAEEELMELSQTHHSGGECSVAAIIFILSLQGLTDVPFRCIDEINQGMDAINERKIYKLIADAAKSGACSQYFLLTPKLLMDLSYHQDVAVHIIFNSPFLREKLNVKEHLRIAKLCRQ